MYDIGTYQDRAYAGMIGRDAPTRDAAPAGTLYPAADPQAGRATGPASPYIPGRATDMNGFEPAATATVEAGAYREAMSRLASAVHLVTTDGPGGRAGFTASAVCSVSDVPPTLLVCVNRTSSAYAALARNDALCVSTLGAQQRDLAAAFGGRTPPGERFALGRWTRLATGAPVLAEALVAFDCRIVARHPAGTHDVLFCEVQALAAPAEADALVYAGRRYHTLPRAPQEPPIAKRRAAPAAA